MDLGISSLTDDQLLDLLQQSCAELATRDGYVRQFAQQTITSEAEKLEEARKALETSAKTVKQEYVRELNAWILKQVRQDVKDGVLRLMPVEEENLIVQAELDARAQVIAEAKASIVNQKEGVAIRINGEMIYLSSPGHNVQAKLPLDPAVVSQLAFDLAAALGTYPKCKYNARTETKIVNSRAEELALGEDWKDSPAAFGAQPPILNTVRFEFPAGRSPVVVPGSKPSQVAHAFIDMRSVRMRLDLVDAAQFSLLPRMNGSPNKLFYDPSNATVNLWPSPVQPVPVELQVTY